MGKLLFYTVVSLLTVVHTYGEEPKDVSQSANHTVATSGASSNGGESSGYAYGDNIKGARGGGKKHDAKIVRKTIVTYSETDDEDGDIDYRSEETQSELGGSRKTVVTTIYRSSGTSDETNEMNKSGKGRKKSVRTTKVLTSSDKGGYGSADHTAEDTNGAGGSAETVEETVVTSNVKDNSRKGVSKDSSLDGNRYGRISSTEMTDKSGASRNDDVSGRGEGSNSDKTASEIGGGRKAGTRTIKRKVVTYSVNSGGGDNTADNGNEGGAGVMSDHMENDSGSSGSTKTIKRTVVTHGSTSEKGTNDGHANGNTKLAGHANGTFDENTAIDYSDALVESNDKSYRASAMGDGGGAMKKTIKTSKVVTAKAGTGSVGKSTDGTSSMDGSDQTIEETVIVSNVEKSSKRGPEYSSSGSGTDSANSRTIATKASGNSGEKSDSEPSRNDGESNRENVSTAVSNSDRKEETSGRSLSNDDSSGTEMVTETVTHPVDNENSADRFGRSKKTKKSSAITSKQTLTARDRALDGGTGTTTKKRTDFSYGEESYSFRGNDFNASKDSGDNLTVVSTTEVPPGGKEANSGRNDHTVTTQKSVITSEGKEEPSRITVLKDTDCSFERGFTFTKPFECRVGNGRLNFQADGDLVVSGRNGQSLWSSGTNGTGERAVFQTDGNLIIFDRESKSRWSSQTQGIGYWLVLQYDCNFVIYSSSNRSVWESKANIIASDSKEKHSEGSTPKNAECTFDRGFTFTKPFECNVGKGRLNFQADGNLVVYGGNGQSLWSSRTNGTGERAVFQTDGNLIIFDRDGKSRWSSQTQGIGYWLVLQYDFNFVIYSSSNKSVWESKANMISSDGKEKHSEVSKAKNAECTFDRGYTFTKPFECKVGKGRLNFQTDGNLVVYGGNGQSLWSSGTNGTGERTVFQTDGNLIIFDRDGKSRWSSQTQGIGYWLVFQYDYNFVIYTSSNRSVWESKANMKNPGRKEPGVTVRNGECTFDMGYTFPKPYECKIAIGRLNFQKDGSLVVFDGNGRRKWSSKTDGTGEKCVFQIDGNLVILDLAGKSIWSSQTQGIGYRLVFQKDRNFVIYNSANIAVWDSHSYDCSFERGVSFPKRYMCKIDIGRLNFQEDGNLVVYKEDGQVKWSSKTNGVGERAVFQADGNLVIYDLAGTARWSSQTQGVGHRLVFQDDRNFVIYTSANIPVWDSHSYDCSFETGVSFPKNYMCKIDKGKLNFQEDGNLVVYDESGQPKWSSHTDRTGERAVFQSDGNLVIYDQSGTARWSSQTQGMGRRLDFRDDRNLVIFNSVGKSIWESRSF